MEPEPSGKGSGSVRQEGVGEGEERMGSILHLLYSIVIFKST